MSRVWKGRELKGFPMNALKNIKLRSAPSHSAADTGSTQGPTYVIALLMAAACALTCLCCPCSCLTCTELPARWASWGREFYWLAKILENNHFRWALYGG